MKRCLLVLAISSVFLTSCRDGTKKSPLPLPTHAGAIKIKGAYALYPLVTLWVAEYQKSHPNVEFKLSAIGSGPGLQELIDDHTDLAMLSSEVTAEFDSLVWTTPVARLGVVFVTSTSNPYLTQIKKQGLTRGDLSEAFTGEPGLTWGGWFGQAGKDLVHPYVRSDTSGATDQLAKFLWVLSSELKGNGVNGEEAMVKAIARDQFALGYCNFRYTFNPENQQFIDGIAIIPLDVEHARKKIDSYYNSVPQLQRAMWTGKYPSILIRDLYLATKGKPATAEVVDFLRWVLTDGQRMVAREGYIEVRTSAIRCKLESLE
ncbi:MAG: PstS family phosphate ABC transporter substrate-binding protein [bacterium]